MPEYLDPYEGHVGPFRIMATKEILKQGNPDKVYEALCYKHGGPRVLQERTGKTERQIKQMIKDFLRQVHEVHEHQGDGKLEATRW